MFYSLWLLVFSSCVIPRLYRVVHRMSPKSCDADRCATSAPVALVSMWADLFNVVLTFTTCNVLRFGTLLALLLQHRPPCPLGSANFNPIGLFELVILNFAARCVSRLRNHFVVVCVAHVASFIWCCSLAIRTRRADQLVFNFQFNLRNVSPCTPYTFAATVPAACPLRFMHPTFLTADCVSASCASPRCVALLNPAFATCNVCAHVMC
jgi:hypothetical protein